MNKKALSILICLALVSLACLQSAVVADGGGKPTTSPTPVMQTSTSSPVVDISPSSPASPVGRGSLCAQVIASKALNLRKGASEHTQILAWLRNGDQVQVIGVDGDWSMIDASGVIGYVRSLYLQKSDCSK
jgi:uncharacterized protein YgiM (DUF1202 family)